MGWVKGSAAWPIASEIKSRTTGFFSSRRRHTRYWRDWSLDVCSSDLEERPGLRRGKAQVGCAQLGQLAPAPQSGQGEGRIGPRAADEADAGREVLEQGRHPAVDGRAGPGSEERRGGHEGRFRWWPDR